MNLIEIVKKAQQGAPKSREKYVYELFDHYKEYFFKQFRMYSPYSEKKDTIEFAADLGNELFDLVKKRIKNFKLKRIYSKEELDHHLWLYLRTIGDSILDRTLLVLSISGKKSRLKEDARRVIEKKYYSYIEESFSRLLHNTETGATINLTGFELEEFLESECARLTEKFITHKFSKMALYFEKNSRAIFRNYLESALNNFFIDYIREENVKKMRRLVLYRDDLPGELFEYLKNLKGYGHLFYYKKRYDSLSIRDTGKALSVIKELNLSAEAFEDIRLIFNKSSKRAEYQRVIDTITAYINNHCPDTNCTNKLSRKNIKILLYINDYVILKQLKKTEQEIEEAKRRLKECVTCLEIDSENFVR